MKATYREEAVSQQIVSVICDISPQNQGEVPHLAK